MHFTELNIGCRTYRRFLQEPVPEDLLQQMVENARIGSSAANGQPLRYYVVRTQEIVEKMQPLVKWAGALPPEIGTPKEGEQPVAFIVIAKAEDANVFADIDVGIACDKICMTAWEQGIGSCIMASINIYKIKELLEIPENYNVRVAIALGKPAHTSTIVDIPEDGKIAYYVDENKDYYVPKRPASEVIKFY